MSPFSFGAYRNHQLEFGTWIALIETEVSKMKHHVYSSLLGGYLAMDFDTKEEAQLWIDTYHKQSDRRERLSIVSFVRIYV